MDSNFTYTLVSDIGSGGLFYNTCNETLDFETHPYEVCVLEIFFNVGAWDNVREGTNQIKWTRQHKIQASNHVAFVKPGYYDNHYDLLITIHHAMTGTKYGGFKTLNTKQEWYKSKVREWEKKVKDDDDLKVLMTRDQLAALEEDKKNTMERYKSMEARWELVFTRETDEEKRLGIFGIRLPPQIAYSLGIIHHINDDVPEINDGFKVDITNNDTTKNSLQLMWIFADFIQPTICGEFLLPVLRMTPIDLVSGALKHTVFSNQHYVAVKRRKMRELYVSIRERLDANPIRIGGRVTMTLHFRRINVQGSGDVAH